MTGATDVGVLGAGAASLGWGQLVGGEHWAGAHVCGKAYVDGGNIHLARSIDTMVQVIVQDAVSAFCSGKGKELA